MCSAMINILCETWLISWVIIYFKSSSNVTYFTEKVWVISWLTCQMICFIVIFFSAWVAHCHPNILLRPHWNKKLFKLYHFLVKCQLLTFMAVLFIDLPQLFYIVFGLDYEFGSRTGEEIELNIIVRVAQGLCGCFSVCIFTILYSERKRKVERQREANRVLISFDRSRKQTWKQNQESENKSEAIECAICLAEYEDESQVIQLTCHKNHIYHRDCLRQFLQNAREGNISGNPKCPLC